ncbi:T9SS type A sorting domain-containing protein [Saccharicrinis sp. FJH54]|uniref:T9SS type A sorting domain-containing protein n=1 Tax=Saccharicrinis sp. FJH54 TaxID=3344665 RepID=UPI0035D4C4FC
MYKQDLHFHLVLYLVLLFVLNSVTLWPQQLHPICHLDNLVSESSGLEIVDGRLISHNDSEGLPELFELDTVSGGIKRTIFLKNASNTDWEAVCSDDDYIYVGDFGNNYGARTNLKIYRLSLDDYLYGDADSLMVDTIRFRYADQSTFTAEPYASDYDAEAFLAFSDSLWIFTKNWRNAKCNIYKLAKTPGEQLAVLRDSFNTFGLITDATYNRYTGKIVLSGYSDEYPMLISIDGFDRTPLAVKSYSRYKLDVFQGFSAKIEGIAAVSSEHYLVTSEVSVTGKAALFSLNLKEMNVDFMQTATEDVLTYIIKENQLILSQNTDQTRISVYNLSGKVIIESELSPVDLSGLAAGVYIILIRDAAHFTGSRKIVIQP